MRRVAPRKRIVQPMRHMRPVYLGVLHSVLHFNISLCFAVLRSASKSQTAWKLSKTFHFLFLFWPSKSQQLAVDVVFDRRPWSLTKHQLRRWKRVACTGATGVAPPLPCACKHDPPPSAATPCMEGVEVIQRSQDYPRLFLIWQGKCILGSLTVVPPCTRVSMTTQPLRFPPGLSCTTCNKRLWNEASLASTLAFSWQDGTVSLLLLHRRFATTRPFVDLQNSRIVEPLLLWS